MRWQSAMTCPYAIVVLAIANIVQSQWSMIFCIRRLSLTSLVQTFCFCFPCQPALFSSQRFITKYLTFWLQINRTWLLDGSIFCCTLASIKIFHLLTCCWNVNRTFYIRTMLFCHGIDTHFRWGSKTLLYNIFHSLRPEWYDSYNWSSRDKL